MPTNEEGEFELVLGNRQLLSVFFIVVVLLGVFFTMGYIVGRNTLPGGTPVAARGGQPMVVEPTPGGGSETPPESERPSPSGSAAAPEPAPSKPEPPARTATREPEPPKSDPGSAKAEPPKSAGTPPAEPSKPAPAAGGQYLQVAATKKAEADLLAEVLTKKGYATVVMPVPEAALFRVLVGPLGDGEIAKTREALTAAGFKPFPRKL